MADDTFFGESLYAGASPEQMLALAANERADFNANLALATEIKQNAIRERQTEIDAFKAQTNHKYKTMQQVFKFQTDLMKNKLAERKVAATEQYMKALGGQAVATTSKMKAELDRINAAEERFQSMDSMKFNIVGSERPWSANDVLMAERLGIKYKFDPASDVKNIYQDEKTREVFAVMQDASVVPIEELRGKKLKSLRPTQSTTINLGPRERAAETGIGRTQADIKSRDYLTNLESALQIDPGYANLRFGGQADPEKKAQADEIVINKILEDISTAWDGAQSMRIPGKGFYIVKPTGKTLPDGRLQYKLDKFIRADIGMEEQVSEEQIKE